MCIGNNKIYLSLVFNHVGYVSEKEKKEKKIAGSVLKLRLSA
jgi:hypothetical protein